MSIYFNEDTFPLFKSLLNKNFNISIIICSFVIAVGAGTSSDDDNCPGAGDDDDDNCPGAGAGSEVDIRICCKSSTASSYGDSLPALSKIT